MVQGLTIFYPLPHNICIERDMVDAPVVLAPVMKEADNRVEEEKEEEEENEELLKTDTKL